MASFKVTPRGDSYQTQVNHKGARYRRQFPDKAGAQQWGADSVAALLRGEEPDMGEQARGGGGGGVQTLQRLLDHVHASRWATQRGADKTLINARDMVQLIGPTMPVAKVRRMEIDNAVQALLKRGCAHATVNRKLSALSTMLSAYEDMTEGYLKPKFPKRLKEADNRIRRVTPEEEAAILGHFERAGREDMRDWAIFALDTGLRRNECLSIQLKDIGEVKLNAWGAWTKSGKNRTVPLTARVKALVERRRAAARNENERLFEALDEHGMRYHWDRMREALGMEDDAEFVPHILRHEFCSRLADRGASAPIIMALAGHSSLATSQKYIHVSGGDLVAYFAGLQVDPSTCNLDVAIPATPRATEGSPELDADVLAAIKLLKSKGLLDQVIG